VVGVFLNGDAITDRDRRGQRVSDDSFLLLFNGHYEPVEWTLPQQWGEAWEPVLDTSDPAREPGDPRDPGTGRDAEPVEAGKPLSVAGRCVVALRRRELPS
jgi:isoamylase